MGSKTSVGQIGCHVTSRGTKCSGRIAGADPFGSDSNKLIAHPIGRCRVEVLDHDPYQWLGPRRPNQHASLISEFDLCECNGVSQEVSDVGFALGQANVLEHLGIGGHGGPGEFVHAGTGSIECIEQLDTCQDTITGRGKIATDHVARLFAAE